MAEVPDMDPLSTYSYPFGVFEHVPNTQYPYVVKLEPSHYPVNTSTVPNINNYIQQIANNIQTEAKTENNTVNTKDENLTQSRENEVPEDSKEGLKSLLNKKKTKKKGKTSSYWNQKVTDSNFPFYGCTICNVNFTTINELDQHVTIHKGRLTSYDIRIRNQLKKKMLRKQERKLKKKGNSVKVENLVPEIEIKPEDGFIGSEKASEFDISNNITSDNNVTNQNNSVYNGALTSSEVTQSGNKVTEVDNKVMENSDKVAEDGNKVMENGKGETENGEVTNDPRLQKLFKCFACQKQFSLSYYLKLHVRSHTDEKPYTCAECGQSFITASKLGRHNKRIHLAIRYQCRICYRFFSRFEYLTRHFDKKHPEDKLEGEPYDYNAILPYLKELEEQLREKAEEQKELKEQKPKAEDLWTDSWTTMDQLHQSMVDSDKKPPEYDVDIKEDKYQIEHPPVDVMIEEVKVDVEEVEIKKEKEEVESAEEEVKDESVRDDSFSDEDYFPSNTWAATPKVEETAPPSPPPKKKYKASEFPRKCDLCEKIINTPYYMKVHLRTHTGEKPFVCYICNRGFITSSKMHRHVLTHTEVWGEGENQIKLEEGVKKENGEEDDKTKNDQVKKLNAKFNRGMVSKKEYKRRPHCCSFCNKRFLHKETLQVHKKCHEGEKLILKCNYCLEEMTDKEAQAEHEKTHTGPKPYVCTICGKCYKKRESMVYHRKNHDPNSGIEDKDFTCEVCSKTFNAQSKLQRHLVSHKVDKFILRYECPVCAHMFNTKYHIQMHLATHQKEGLIIEENRNEILAMVLQNARKIPKKTDVSINIQDLIPSDERSRVCNICGQVFQHFYYLEEHLKSHGSKIAIEDTNQVDEKKHVCPVCNKGFKLHYYLKLHSFTHTKEKPYICQQCGKGFITKGKLKRHLETHTGLKKYQCHICYKFFTRPSYLRIHVRTIHGTQDYNFRSFSMQPLGHDII